MIRSLILFSFLINPFFVSSPRVFGCTCFVHILTPGQDKLSTKAAKCIFLGYSRLQCTNPKVLSLPLIFPLSALSSKSPATSPRPLQVYTRPPRIDTGSPDDTSSMAPPSTTLVLPSTADPPISIRKGTRSFCNPHPIYTFLSYHRLSSPYSAFISTPCLLFLFLTLYMRPSPIRARNMQWFTKWLLCILLAHGT